MSPTINLICDFIRKKYRTQFSKFEYYGQFENHGSSVVIILKITLTTSNVGGEL